MIIIMIIITIEVVMTLLIPLGTGIINNSS